MSHLFQVTSSYQDVRLSPIWYRAYLNLTCVSIYWHLNAEFGVLNAKNVLRNEWMFALGIKSVLFDNVSTVSRTAAEIVC